MHSLFNDEFFGVYNSLPALKRRTLLPYLQSIYRRWYHSTLIEDIHFAPVNIAGSVAHHCGMQDGTHIAAILTAPPTKIDKIDFRVLHYSAKSHPIVADLYKVVESCSPHIDLCEEWCFSDAQSLKIAKKLTLYDPYYASFLLELSCKMGLVERMPSLHVQRVQVSTKAQSFFSQPDAELFMQIIDTVIEMTSHGLQGCLPAPVALFTEDGLRSLLANPICSDEIFSRAFSSLGYNIDELPASILASQNNAYEESDSMAEMLSGIFVLGIMLDRLFFTPFGYFLRIIRPTYSIPFNMKEEIAHYIGDGNETEDDFAAFFSPCTSFTLSELGAQVLGIEPTKWNYLDTRTILHKDVIDDVFASQSSLLGFVAAAQAAIPVSARNNSIYTFSVCEKADPESWVHIQIPKSFTLEQLYEEIVDTFCIDEEGDAYSFYHGQAANPFVEYSGGYMPKRANKLSMRISNTKRANVTLDSLDFDHEKHMLLMLGAPDEESFALEWLGETVPNPQEHYPRTSRLSETMQDMFEDFDSPFNFFEWMD